MIVVHQRVDGCARGLRCGRIDDLESHVSRQRPTGLGHLERRPHSGQLRLAARRLRSAERINRAKHEVWTLIGRGLPAACCRGKHQQGDESEEPDHPGQNIRYAVAACSPAPRASASWRSSFGAVAYP